MFYAKSKMEMQKKNSKNMFTSMALFAMMALVLTVAPTFAVPVPPALVRLLDDMIGYIGIIFQVIGILIGIYAVGQMFMSAKDDNSDAKVRSTTLLVVCVFLIVLPQIIKQINFAQYLGK